MKSHDEECQLLQFTTSLKLRQIQVLVHSQGLQPILAGHFCPPSLHSPPSFQAQHQIREQHPHVDSFTSYYILYGCQVVFNCLQPHGFPCPTLYPGVFSNSCPLSQQCCLTIESSATPFSFCLHSFPASGCFPVGQLFMSSGQSIGASALAPVLPMNIQG